MTFNYSGRLAKLQQAMKQQELDAFVISTQDSIYYFSGVSYQPIERPFFIVVKQQGPFDLLVPYLEYEHMKKVQTAGHIRYYFEYPTLQGENWYDILNDMLSGCKRVGIEPELSISKRDRLQVIDAVVSDAILTMRMVKEPEEIAAIRSAAAWTDKGMKALHGSIYKGCSVIETVMPARQIQTGVIKTGVYDYLNCSFLTAGWPAPKSAQPHSVPDFHSVMGQGPIVLMSYNRVNGYAAECERTVFIGNPSERDKELFFVMMQARETALKMVKPGVPCAEIDAATQAAFKSKGYEANIIHRTGHGIGLGNHEQPWISAGSGDVLEENMVISIEPAVYFEEIGGFRHSDTVLVTKDGYELLTQYPTDLDALVVKGSRVMKKLKGAMVRKAINY